MIGFGIGTYVGTGPSPGAPGGGRAPAVSPPETKFALFLYEGDEFDRTADARALAAEYAAWASELRDRGVTITGEELGWALVSKQQSQMQPCSGPAVSDELSSCRSGEIYDPGAADQLQPPTASFKTPTESRGSGVAASFRTGART